MLQGAAGSQYSAGGQCGLQGGAEVPEDPAGGGARAGSSFQAFPTQHPLSVHGAGLPRRRRGQLALSYLEFYLVFVFGLISILKSTY